jgi:hypothetical protein
MAISFINASTANATSSAISTAKPTNTASGDVVIFVPHWNADKTSSDNNGGTPASKQYGVNHNGAGGSTYEFWYRVCGGSEPANYAWTLSGSDRWAITAMTFRGVDTSNVFETAPSLAQDNTGTSTTASSKSIATSKAGGMVIVSGFVDNAVTTFSATPADSFTTASNLSVSWTVSTSSEWWTNTFSLNPMGGSKPLFFAQY